MYDMTTTLRGSTCFFFTVSSPKNQFVSSLLLILRSSSSSFMLPLLPSFKLSRWVGVKIQKKQRQKGPMDAYFTLHPETVVQNRTNDNKANYDEWGIQKGNKGAHHPKNYSMVLWCGNTSQCLQLWMLCPYGWSNWAIRSLIERACIMSWECRVPKRN